MDSKTDRLIREAIARKKLIQFRLHGRTRVAEPHDYGIKKGSVQLLVFQVGGESQSGGLPNWRWVDMSKASDFSLLEQTFPGGRNTSGKHTAWDQLFVRVD